MSEPYDHIKGMFYASIDDDLIEDGMRLLAAAYRAAHDECEGSYPWEESHDLKPHVRRAKIDSGLRELANAYPGVTATAEANLNHSSYHTRMTSNNVILTVSHVNHPSEIVRPAEFRNSYARDAQQSLFEPYKPPPKDGMLYAIWLHGASSQNPARPDFMQIVFPDETCNSYLCCIDLFAHPRFKSLATELWPAQLETVNDDLKVDLRPDAKKKKKKEEDGNE